MKQATKLIAIWVLNFFVLLMYLEDRARYDALMQAGYEWYTCQEPDADGNYRPSDACTDAMPTWRPE